MQIAREGLSRYAVINYLVCNNDEIILPHLHYFSFCDNWISWFLKLSHDMISRIESCRVADEYSLTVVIQHARCDQQLRFGGSQWSLIFAYCTTSARTCVMCSTGKRIPLLSGEYTSVLRIEHQMWNGVVAHAYACIAAVVPWRTDQLGTLLLQRNRMEWNGSEEREGLAHLPHHKWKAGKLVSMSPNALVGSKIMHRVLRDALHHER